MLSKSDTEEHPELDLDGLTQDRLSDPTEPGDPTHTEPGDPTHTEPGDPTHTETGDPTHTETGDPTHTETDNTRTEPGGPGEAVRTAPGDTRTEPGDESAVGLLGDHLEDGTIARASFGEHTEERLPYALTGPQPTLGHRRSDKDRFPTSEILEAGEKTIEVETGPIDDLPAHDPATAQVPAATANQLRFAMATLGSGNNNDDAPEEDHGEPEPPTAHEIPTRRKPNPSKATPSKAPADVALVPVDKRRFGRYSLLCRIASGGMADLFLANFVGPGGFEKLVAIKRIHEHLSKSEDFVQMFLDEARLAARISHPNVVDVLELGTVSDNYFIAMEYVAGQTVRTVVKEAVLPMHIAARMISNAAAGLHAAHELRDPDGELLHVVHRDVSPGNILVSYEGAVKVADFGVARARGNLHTTQSGTVKGKFAYMAPEQASGEVVDRRADIFALGVILYEITTRRRLFKAESEHVTLAKVIAGEIVPPSRVVPRYPKILEKIVMKALERIPSQRFQTANELHEALEGFIHRTGKRVTAMTIGGLMKRVFSEQIRQREEIVRNSRLIEEDQIADATASMMEEPSFTLDGTLSDAIPPRFEPSPPRRPFPTWAIVTSLTVSVVLFVAALVLAFGQLGGDKDDESQRVTISIRALPADATVTIDGEPLPQPGEWSVPRSDHREAKVVVSSPGYVTRRLSVPLGASTQLLLALERKRGPP